MAPARSLILASMVVGFTWLGRSPVESAPVQQVTAERSLSDNLLGNAGFETWSHGVSVQGAIPPDLWYPMGTTTNLFGQTAIRISRVPEEVGGDAPPWAAELTANDPQNFVSQRLENAGELRGRQVTFSVDVRTRFGAAHPSIEIDDGVTTSSTSLLIQVGTAWTRLVVRHRVHELANQLAFRIYPDQTIEANAAMAIIGNAASFVPRSNPEPALMQLPIGAVVDWWRFSPEIPVPEGFAIADGSLIDDSESPMFGLTLPDLTDRFVRGVVSVGDIGNQGGSASMNLSHDHQMSHHHDGRTGQSDRNGFNFWIQGGGAGRPALDDHRHDFTTDNGSRSHTGSALGEISILPPWIGLLKIVRVR